MKKKILLIALLIILCGIGYFAYGKIKAKFCTQLLDDAQSTENQSEKKEQASDFILQDLSGQEITLSKLKGKKVFLNLWATWCPPCRGEMPFINEIFKENKDIEILAVSSQEDIKTVQKYIDDNKYEFKVLLDTDGKVAREYKAYAIPMSVLIDEEGNVINTHTGAMTKEELLEFMQL